MSYRLLSILYKVISTLITWICQLCNSVNLPELFPPDMEGKVTSTLLGNQSYTESRTC